MGVTAGGAGHIAAIDEATLAMMLITSVLSQVGTSENPLGLPPVVSTIHEYLRGFMMI